MKLNAKQLRSYKRSFPASQPSAISHQPGKKQEIYIILDDVLDTYNIKSQQATAVGTITQVSNDQIVVEGDDHTSISLKFSPTVTVYSKTVTSAAAINKPETGPGAIKLNQKAVLTLVYQGGVLTVTSISYL